MLKEGFSRLNALSFLKTFITQAIRITECGNSASTGTVERQSIEQLGLHAGGCFEIAYRHEVGIDGPLTMDAYADLIVRLKNQIGGSFSRVPSEPGTVRVVNTRCPFGEAVKDAPQLCRMTSSVFGGIAARNFSCAKVQLLKRIATHDDICDILIHTDPGKFADLDGDVYYVKDNKVFGKDSCSDVQVRIEKQMYRVWCAAQRSKNSRATSHESKPAIVAHSRTMVGVLETIEIAAPTDATVLITGETGVGKEIVARAVHALSPRWERPFVAVNCGAIPENLVESALFGHERGAFTGAHEMHHGYFERAEGGTLFFDEIDSLPPLAQAGLLRILQEGEYERVGGKRTLISDVRLVVAAATHLDQVVAGGGFRRNLFYRLNVIPIHVPPLRDRPEDILPLTEHFLKVYGEKYGKPNIRCSEAALRQILAHDWPGNVRELENVLERSILFSQGQTITQLHLQIENPVGGASAGISPGGSLREAKREAATKVEALLLRHTLRHCGGNVREAAGRLGITARAVHQKLRSHGIIAALFRGSTAAWRRSDADTASEV